MIHTSRQLKDLVRNLAKSSGIEAHVLIRRYMMERLLERISLSPFNTYAKCYTWDCIICSVQQLYEKAGLRVEKPTES